MKNTAKKLLLASLALAAFAVPRASAQLGNLGDIMNGGTQDANYLLRGYLSPLADGFGASLNTGWIQSAQPHGFLPIPGFHVRLSANVTMLPATAKSFTIDPSKLQALEITNGVTSTATASGRRNGSTAQFNLKSDPTNSPLFSMPKGLGASIVPTPMIQAGIGLPFKTQLMVRYVPTTDISVGVPGRDAIDFGTVGLWGVGFQHDILHYIPVAKNIPLLNASVVGGFNQYNMSKKLGGDREFDWTTNAWNVNVIAGLTTPFIKILSVYAGAGFEQANTSVKMTGTYSTPTGNVTDPVNFEIKGGNGFRTVAGARFKLALLTLNAEYTKAEFSSYTVGVGLSFR